MKNFIKNTSIIFVLVTLLVGPFGSINFAFAEETTTTTTTITETANSSTNATALPKKDTTTTEETTMEVKDNTTSEDAAEKEEDTTSTASTTESRTLPTKYTSTTEESATTTPETTATTTPSVATTTPETTATTTLEVQTLSTSFPVIKAVEKRVIIDLPIPANPGYCISSEITTFIDPSDMTEGNVVYKAIQGLDTEGDFVRSSRSVPNNGVTFESDVTSQSDSYFYSLGFGGEMVTGFDGPIVNGPGNDVTVVEITWADFPYPDESADVFASKDGISWTKLGNAVNNPRLIDGNLNNFISFDLGSLDYANYIKLVDTTSLQAFLDYDSNVDPSYDGFDLNAILVNHSADYTTCGHPPVITLTGANPITLTVGDSFTDPGATATDVEDGNLTTSIVVTGTVNVLIPGTYILTYTVTDSDGNTVSTTRDIIVEGAQEYCTFSGHVFDENGAPLSGWSVGIDKAVFASGVYINGGVFDTDVTDENGQYCLQVPPQEGQYVESPQFYVFEELKDNWSVVDVKLNGHTTEWRSDDVREVFAHIGLPINLTIEDEVVIDFYNKLTVVKNIPTIAVVGANPLSIATGAVFTDPGATANDIEDGNLTTSIVVTGTVNVNVPGTYTLTYTVTDSDNNTVSTTRQVIVASINLPCTVSGHKYDENGNPLSDWTIGLGVIDKYIVYGDSGLIKEEYVGLTLVTDATDENGEYCIHYELPVGQYIDSVPEYFVFEELKDNWNVVDVKINASSTPWKSDTKYDVFVNLGRTIPNVAVVDFYNKLTVVKNLPVIQLVGTNPITIIEGSVFTDPGATANDIEDGNLTTSIVVTGTVNVLIPGTYTLTYTVTDSDGNTVSTTREVIVSSNGGGGTKHIPTIAVVGANPLTIDEGNTFTDPGATADDVEDGNLTGSIVVTGTVNKNVPGTYTLTYTVTDSDGNTVSAKRSVIVRALGGSSFSGSHRRPISGGEVLGTSTDTSCGIYLHNWIKEEWDNDYVEVLKLQIFLVSEGFNSPVNGTYDKATINAVNAFQFAHKELVLKPWAEIGFGDGYTPTGFVYKTTQWMINEIVCPGIAPFPVLD